LIADDNPLVRSAIRLLLESHFDWIICGEAANGFEAVEQAAALKPNVILLDISMPDLDGLTAVPLIRQRAPEAEIIILTLHESLDMARTAASKGATVYIAKSLITDALVPAIESLQSKMNVLHQFR
jgi:two-component system, NarL family, response regulator NreC